MIDYLKKINIESSKKKDKADADNNAHLSENENDKQNKQDSTPTWAEILMKGCVEGERNQRATQLIGYLFKTKLDEKEIWETVVTWNKNNKPPMDLDELKKIFDSVRGYGTG